METNPGNTPSIAWLLECPKSRCRPWRRLA